MADKDVQFDDLGPSPLALSIDTTREMSKAEATKYHNQLFIGESIRMYALLKIREEQGWKALGFESFREYAESPEIVELFGSTSNVYRTADQAEVCLTLSLGMKKQVLLPMTTALELKPLEPDQRIVAFNRVTGGKIDARPTAKQFEKVVAQLMPKSPRGGGGGGGTRKKKAGRKEEQTSWTPEFLRSGEDNELSMAFVSVAGVWGSKDVDAIRNGTIGLNRAEVLYLTKLHKPKLQEIQDLVMGKRWKPKDAVEFVNTMPDENTTVEELQNYCLATKGKFFTMEIGGFTITCKNNRASKR
jgi:hypothetical protein